MFIPKSEKRISACFFNSSLMRILIVFRAIVSLLSLYVSNIFDDSMGARSKTASIVFGKDMLKKVLSIVVGKKDIYDG